MDYVLGRTYSLAQCPYAILYIHCSTALLCFPHPTQSRLYVVLYQLFYFVHLDLDWNFQGVLVKNFYNQFNLWLLQEIFVLASIYISSA